VLRVLFAPNQTRFRPRSVLVSDKYEARVRALVEASAFAQTPIYVTSPSTMDRLVGFPIHRGILALVDRGEPISARTLAEPLGPRLLVALIGVVNHDN